MQIDIKHEDYKNGRKGMGDKKIVHRIVLVRHGETRANVALMTDVDIKAQHTLDTCLTEDGLRQGEDIASFLIEVLHYAPDEIIYSRLDRAYRTALPLLTKTKANYISSPRVTKDELWSENNFKRTETIIDHEQAEWVYPVETEEEFVHRTFSAFDILRQEGTPASPKQTVVFTHSQVINTVLSRCLSSEVLVLKEPYYFHLSNGSLTCIDVDECRHCHVQTVNYTRHLATPSGHHSPFV